MVEADISSGDLDPEMRETLNSIMEELVDEVALGLCFEIHRSCKIGSLLLNGFDDPSDTDYAIVARPGVDVLGQVASKKNYECVCPNCQRHLAASRFAPHLEKCMGMGRNSSRIASRRIANNQKHGSDESGQDDENDNDWNYAPESSRRLRKIKKEKSSNSNRNRRIAKLRNGAHHHEVTPAVTTSAETTTSHEGQEQATNYESMSLEERKALLFGSCGVISEHTKKMCTRTGKCVQHTDEQRRLVRQSLLRQSRAHDLEDTHIDIDTYDDAESQSLRESLHWEASSNSSPADSNSTTNSTTNCLKRATKHYGKSSKNKKAKTTKTSLSSSSSASSTKDQANLYDFNI